MIKTPQELLEFMSEFKYEWMDKNGNFHEEITPNAYEDYSLMIPEEVLKYKRGICVDQSEFERDWFSKNNYEHKVMVIQIEKEDSKPGHQFLIYKENDKYYWFENAWYNERGIHEYNSYEELIEDIKHKFIIQNDITEQELNNIEIFEQIKFPYHLSYEEMDKYKYKEELKKILSIIEEKHIDMYFAISKEELNKYIEELLTKYELKNKYDLYYLANVIIKKIFGRYDSHTKLVWKNADFNLPIRLKYMDGKVYIIKTSDDNKDMLYGELLSINNIPLEQLIKEIGNITPYSTNEFLYTQIENTLYNGIKLKSLPSIKTDSKSFEFKILKEGKVIRKELTKSNVRLYQDKNYTYNIIDGVMHIIYSSCSEKYEGQMLEFVNQISEESKKNNITKFVVDIRNNVVGNSSIINPLIEFLRGKDVVTLTDKYVFSGGRFALYDLKNIGSITLGTGIGTTLNCFGNNCINYTDDFILPVSFKYFYYNEVKKEIINIRTKEDFVEFKNNHNNLLYFEPQIFEPDYYVENTIEDYENEYDRQLDSALLLFNTRLKNDRKEKFLQLKTPEELMEFLDNNISYGWLDKNNRKYINTLSHVREKYRTSSIEEILETGLVTCAEDAKLIKYFFDRIGLENKLFCHRSYETEENFDKTVKMHCFVLFKKDGYWYYFEHSMTPIKGIRKYNSIDEALNWITSKWNKNERQLAEIDDIPDHLSFQELNQYVNQFDLKELNERGKTK